MEFLRIAEELKLCKRCERANLVEVQHYRITRRSRLIANEVIDEKGHFSEKNAQKLLQNLNMPTYGPFDSFFTEHVKNVLTLFLESNSARIRLRQLSFPLANPYVERLIGYSLLLKKGDKLEKRAISQAVLIALMTFLRQSVGSCFATAPLIIVQQEQIGFLLEDLYDLITRGFLKRVIEGEEYKVPISIKTGHSDLLKIIGPEGILDPTLEFIFGKDIESGLRILDLINKKLPEDKAKDAEELFKAHSQSPLLKCYEFTVASFSDWKTNFSQWNMYTSLGLSHEEEGGIGEKLYTALNEKLERINDEINSTRDEIERGNESLRLTQTLLRNAHSIDKIRRLKTELQYKEHNLLLNEENYHEQVKKSEQFAKFFQFLIDQFLQFFPFYFQEVYDPEMFEEQEEVYEDRPAGFRLLYKHGRYDPTVWTMIYNENEYKDALINFFQIIEPIVTTACEFEEGKELVKEMIDQVIERVQNPIFIQTAVKRTTQMHQEKLNEYAPRKPWAYISGGNLESLVKCYFNLGKNLTQSSLEPNDPLELCVGLIELMKDLPYTVTATFETSPLKGLLMVNPVHAFVLKPGLEPFSHAWQFRGNTFTYLRDEIIEKAKQWYINTPLNLDEIIFILEPLGIDPIQGSIKEIYSQVRKNQPEKFPYFQERFLTALIAKGAPSPFVFADSNWVCDFLAFIVNPETYLLEIWRFDGRIARPLNSWKEHFNKQKWTVFTNPIEYLK